MSIVHVLIKKNNKIYFIPVHFRTALRILETKASEIMKLMPGKYADAGYLVLDLDSKTIINCQNAIAIPPRIGLEIIEV